MRSSGFAFEELMMRGAFEGFSDQVFTEMIDLNMGKWACLENSLSGGSEKSPSSVISTISTTATKKLKLPSPTPRCKVDGCNLDLSGENSKDYHRKHRVCDSHSKSPKVIVKGLECRFCQQCSRFHGLLEFDEKKRSCRKRLSAHNARRRKKQQERIGFNSSWLPASSFYGQQLSGNQVYYPINMHGSSSNGFLAPYGTATSGVLTAQGFRDATSANNFDVALSLLSTNNSWGSCEPVSIPFDNIGRMVHAVPPSYWLLNGQPSTYPRGIGTDFYSSPLHYY